MLRASSWRRRSRVGAEVQPVQARHQPRHDGQAADARRGLGVELLRPAGRVVAGEVQVPVFGVHEQPGHAHGNAEARCEQERNKAKGWRSQARML